MLRFTRRQYETVLRRGGVPESGLGFEDKPFLVGILDDFRPQLPEQRIHHAYVYAPCTAEAAEMPMLECTSPEGGMTVLGCGCLNPIGNWGYGVGLGTSLVVTLKATPTPRQIRDDVGDTRATFRVGTAVAAFTTLMLAHFANTVLNVDLVHPLYVPSGRRFFIHSVTANDVVEFTLRWTEPGA